MAARQGRKRGLRLLQHPQVRRQRPALRSGPGRGGDRRDRRRRHRAAGGGPALRRSGRAARPPGARARPGLVPVPVTTGIAATAGTATWCWCARARCDGLRQIALPGLEPRGALVADLDLAMGPVRVVAAHLGLLRHSRLLQVEALLAHAGETTDRPVVLMGDINEWRREPALGAAPASRRASGRSARACRASRLFSGAGARPGHGPAARHHRARSRRTRRRWRGSRPTTCRSRRGPARHGTRRHRRGRPPSAALRRRDRAAAGEDRRGHDAAPRLLAAALRCRRSRARPGRSPSREADTNHDGYVTYAEAERVFPQLHRSSSASATRTATGSSTRASTRCSNNFYWMYYRAATEGERRSGVAAPRQSGHKARLFPQPRQPQ